MTKVYVVRGKSMDDIDGDAGRGNNHHVIEAVYDPYEKANEHVTKAKRKDAEDDFGAIWDNKFDLPLEIEEYELE